MNYDPSEIRRLIQISFALEPLDDKPGLTNREQDFNKHTKLQYFITGAVNIGDAFAELATRTTGPYYDLCLKAQQDSMKNRAGYKLNYGSIIANFPLILTQLKMGPCSVEEWLANVPQVLKDHTNNEDCKYLQEMRNIAYGMSPYEKDSPNIRDTKDFNYNSVFDYYTECIEKTWATRGERGVTYYDKGSVTDSVIGGTGLSDIEITEGFPTLLEMWILCNKLEGDKYSRITDTWKYLVSNNPNKGRYHPIWLADLSTSLYYLVLTNE